MPIGILLWVLSSYLLSLYANIVQVPSTKTLILEIRILKNAPFHLTSQPENHKN